MANKLNIFFFGFGHTAKYLCDYLIEKKLPFDSAGTSRNSIEYNKIKYFYFENDKFDKNIIPALENSTHILISTPPTLEKNISKFFSNTINQSKNLKWLGYLSSTSVYGNHEGNWVNEDTICKPSSLNGKKRLEAESVIKKFKKNRIFRLSGIYSKERNIFDRLKANQIEGVVDDEKQVFSRIHVEDIARVLFESFEKLPEEEILNISDDLPCSYKETVLFASNLLKISPPPLINIDHIKSNMMKEFYLDKKKVSNKKMKSILGYKLKYPTYKEGLTSIFENIS